MNFLAPGAFFLGLLLPVIVALYLLKLRRVERMVPSNYLWRRMVRDVEANAPWQKLRANLLLVLQLLVLSVLILALTRPFVWREGISGEAAIFILDSSSSMTATDVLPNRLESAKKRAVQLVDDLPDRARVTIIEAGREARVLLSSSLDRRQAHMAIENIKAGIGGSDLAVALELASAIASRQPGTEIIVLSDGNAELPRRLKIKGQLSYIPFGLSAKNLAISRFTLEKSAASEDLTAFIQISNYGEELASCRLSIFADERLANAYDLSDIPPGGQKSIITEGLGVETGVIKALITSQGDAFALDNQAQAVRPVSLPIPVTLVTQGNRFLKTALSLLPGIILTEQIVNSTEAETSATPAFTPEPDQSSSVSGKESHPALVIYDATVPDILPQTSSLLFIAPPKSTIFFSVTGLVENPTVRPVDLADPLLSQVSLSNVNILDAMEIPLPAWATPVVAGDLSDGNSTLIFRGFASGQKIAVIAFDLRHSDLPLQMAFPIMMANLVNWLAPGSSGSVPEEVTPGDSVIFPSTGLHHIARLTRPDGSIVEIIAKNNQFVVADTSQLGVYELQLQEKATDGITWRDKTHRFAVNLFSPQESNIKPANNLPGVEIEGSTLGQDGTQAMREWWRIFALLGLGLLVGEWLVYQRAALSRVRDILRSAWRSIANGWRRLFSGSNKQHFS